MKKLLCTCISITIVLFANAQDVKVCLEEDTRISIVLMQDINSQKFRGIPAAEVAADVWNEDGDMILIRKGTPVTLQVKVRKANIDSAGKIEIKPISTTAYNGREISFADDGLVEFLGNTDAFFSGKSKVKVVKGTAFSARIANKYCFKK